MCIDFVDKFYFLILFNVFAYLYVYFSLLYPSFSTIPQNIHKLVHLKTGGCPPIFKRNFSLEISGIFGKNKRVIYISTAAITTITIN